MKKKIVLGAAAPLILMCLVGAIGVFAIASLNKTSKWVNHTHDVLAQASTIVAGAVDMETGMRGFLLAGEDAFLEPYIQGAEQTYSTISRLKETVSDNPGQVARLEEVETTLREWQSNVTEMQIALRREIGDAPTMNDIAVRVGEARGKTYFDGFREMIATFIEREQALLTTRRQRLDRNLELGLTSSKDAAEAIRWVVHTHEVVRAAEVLLSQAINMETGMRGYLLAGKPTFLTPYEDGKSQFFSGLKQLQTKVADNPQQVALLEDIRKTITEWSIDVVTPAIELRTSIGDAKTMDDMADLVGEALGKRYFDGFRQLMADFRAEEEALMEVRKSSLDRVTVMADVGIISTIIVALVVGIALAIKIANSISKPIVGITVAMRGLVEGATDVRIEGQERKDEVGDIARASQVFKENAEKIEEMAKADAETSKKLQEIADRERKEVEERAIQEREASAQAQARQEMMRELQQSISEVAAGAVAGEFDHRVIENFEDKDLSDLAKRVNRLMQVVSNGLKETAGVLAKFANGDLDVRMDGEFHGAFLDLQNHLNGTIDRLSGMVSEISVASETVSENSVEISSDAHALANRTTQQAAEVEETAAAMVQMNASIAESAQHSEHVKEMVADTSRKASSGSDIADTAITAMNEIETVSKEITETVSLIDSIAFQTNLLALNASVEAARAGDAGKGFAVVAAEVRGLAQRASSASSDIRSLITMNEKAVVEGVKLISEAGVALTDISLSVKDVENLINQIAIASKEQAASVDEISVAVGSFEQGVQQNAIVAEKTADNVSALSKSSKKLNALLEFFQSAEIAEKNGPGLAGATPRSAA